MTSIEEYFAASFEEAIPGYRSRRAGDRDLLAMTKMALLEGLKITDELPRSHWVWQPGYAVQTVNLRRLKDLCRFRLREDPFDELALWVRIGLALGAGVPEFGQEHFKILQGRDGFDAAWPVYAACFVQRVWAAFQRVKLGSFLRETGLLDAASPTIDAIRERRDPYIDVFEVEEFTREYAAECLEIALWVE